MSSEPFEIYFGKRAKQHRTIDADRELGKQKEVDLLPLLREHFKDDSIAKVNNKYSIFDFESSKTNTKYELKSRTNSSFRYPTTMISLSKVSDAEASDSDCYFIFSFTDSVKYIKYDKSKFAEYETKYMARKDRGKTEGSTYSLIPVKELLSFE
jgi:hypothetical protein